MLRLPSLLHQQRHILSCGLVYSFKKQISITHSALQFASSTLATELLTQTTLTATNWSLTKYTLIFIQLDQKVGQTQKVFKCGYDLTTAKQKWLFILIFGLRSLIYTRARPEMDSIWNQSSKHWWKSWNFIFFPLRKPLRLLLATILTTVILCWKIRGAGLQRWGTEVNRLLSPCPDLFIYFPEAGLHLAFLCQSGEQSHKNHLPWWQQIGEKHPDTINFAIHEPHMRKCRKTGFVTNVWHYLRTFLFEIPDWE